MPKTRINASYDDFADVLYLTSGKIAYTKNLEDEAGLVLRYDLKSRKPVGATIIDFKEYWLPKKDHLIERLAQFFGTSITDVKRLISSV